MQNRIYDIGQNIKELREDLGLSKRELAKKAGVSYHTIHRIEMGTHSPTVDSLGYLADYFDQPISRLFWNVN